MIIPPDRLSGGKVTPPPTLLRHVAPSLGCGLLQEAVLRVRNSSVCLMWDSINSAVPQAAANRPSAYSSSCMGQHHIMVTTSSIS